MKSVPWKKILVVLAVGGVAFVIYSIVRAFIAGARDLKTLFFAPFTAAAAAYDYAAGKVSDAASTIAGGASAVAQLPSLTSNEVSLHNLTQSSALAAYAPGGSLYTQIQASQGTAAADAAYAKVQADYANEGNQVATDSSVGGYWTLLNPFNW